MMGDLRFKFKGTYCLLFFLDLDLREALRFLVGSGGLGSHFVLYLGCLADLRGIIVTSVKI